MKKRIIAILLCLTILLIILVLILSGAIKSSDENTYLTLVNKTHTFPDDWVSDPEPGEEYCKKISRFRSSRNITLGLPSIFLSRKTARKSEIMTI